MLTKSKQTPATLHSHARYNYFWPRSRACRACIITTPLLLVSLTTLTLQYLLYSYLEEPWPDSNADLQPAQHHLREATASSHAAPSSSLPNSQERFDYWPKGCQWRTTTTNTATLNASKSSKTSVEHDAVYEFWSNSTSSWTSAQPPPPCQLPQASTATEHYKWLGGAPLLGGECTTHKYCIFQNLWMQGGDFYFLSEPGIEAPAAIKLSRNRVGRRLAVNNATEFVNNVEVVVIPGTTVIIDWIYIDHLGAIGHWPEFIAPLFSVSQRETQRLHFPPRQVVVLGQQRSQFSLWVRSMMAIGLGIQQTANAHGVEEGIKVHAEQQSKRGGMLPMLWFQEERVNSNAQRESPLQGSDGRWVCFEKVVWVQDVFTKGTREFLTQEDARMFRKLVYNMHGLQLPSLDTKKPSNHPRITFLRKSTNRRVLNEDELLGMLQTLGPVTAVEFTADTPFLDQLILMSRTDVLVSVHTSALSNAMFLPPGAAVFEIIPKSWSWASIDQAFVAFSWALGDVFHFAWRATGHHTVFIDARNARKFGNWTTKECSASVACVEALTQTDVRVDVEALRELMIAKLAVIEKRDWEARELYEPWPQPD